MNLLFSKIEILEKCWEYFVLGVIQGITEFLPISSTAHLKIIPMLIGWDDPGMSVSAAIQLGSIVAIIIYFRRELQKTIKAILQGMSSRKRENSNSQLGLSILNGSIPIVIAGISIKLFWPGFENSLLRSIPVISLASIGMALLLAYAERVGSRKKDIKDINKKDAILIGLGQMLAIIPGVSRSGITLTTALIYGYQRKDAAIYSFLLGIPAISISGLVELKESLSQDFSNDLIPLLIGILTSAIVSWIAIDWLLKYLKRNSTNIFIKYRLIFGISLIIWWTQLI